MWRYVILQEIINIYIEIYSIQLSWSILLFNCVLSISLHKSLSIYGFVGRKELIVMEDLNMSANLSDMLERLSEEQNQLSERVEEKEREKASWEHKVTVKKMVLDKVETELNKIKKEGFVVEDELRMKVRQQKMLVGDLGQDEQAVPVFGIQQKTAILEEMKRKVEKLEVSRMYFDGEKKELDRGWNELMVSVKGL